MPYVYSTGTWGDLLTSYNGGSITYDSIGNPLSYYNGNNFTWEGRRLVGAVVGSKTLNFAYNDEGIRTSKTVNGVKTNYYYYGSQLLAEETNGNVTVYLYNSTGLIGFQYHGASYSATAWDTYFYEKNLQGDIIAVYDANGAKKISYVYNAWGAFTTTYHNGASASTVSNAFTYRGYYYDKDLGLYYLMSRYYDANICRFINADTFVSTGQGMLGNNMFIYCGNNPIAYIDHTGMFGLAIMDNSYEKWNKIATFLGDAFGAEYSEIITTNDKKTVFPNWSPVNVETGYETIISISKLGDSSKPISVYAKKDLNETILNSAVGINININAFVLNFNLSLSDIGVYGSIVNGDVTQTVGVNINPAKLRIGVEGSTTYRVDDNLSEKTYFNANVNIWFIVAMYCFVTTGQSAPVPAY